MSRAYLILLLIIGLLFLIAYKLRSVSQVLSVAMFSIATVLLVLLVGAFYGVIGG